MAATINPTKFKKFREAYDANDGLLTPDQEKEILGNGVSSEPYYEALKRDAEKPAPAAEPTKEKPAASGNRKFKLRNADGTSSDLEILNEGTTTTVLQLPVKKDLVTIKLRGEDVVVDLIELRAKPGNAMHFDQPVALLIQMAEAAR